MTIKDFLEFIEHNDVPETADLVIWADYAREPVTAYTAAVSRSPTTYYAEMIFEVQNYTDYYDEDALENYPDRGEIAAVCLCGE